MAHQCDHIGALSGGVRKGRYVVSVEEHVVVKSLATGGGGDGSGDGDGGDGGGGSSRVLLYPESHCD